MSIQNSHFGLMDLGLMRLKISTFAACFGVKHLCYICAMRCNGWFCIILILRSGISDDSDIEPTLDYLANDKPVCPANQVWQNRRTREC